MPFRTVSAVLAAWLLASIAIPAAAQDPAKGAALLLEARNAIGGDAKLAEVKRLEVKGLSRRSAGTTNIEGEIEIFVELPDKFRRNESISFGPGSPGIDRVEVLNAGESWEQTSGGGGRRSGAFAGDSGAGGGGRNGAGPSPADLERLRENQLRNRRADFARLMLAFLLTTDAPVTWIGTAESPDGTADVLEVTRPGEPATRLLLDSASHLPLMMSWQGAAGPRGGGFGRRGGGRRGGDPDTAGTPPARGGDTGGRGFQPATFEMHFSEYRAVNGIRLPHLITRGLNGQTNEELQIKSFRINPSLRPNTFTR